MASASPLASFNSPPGECGIETLEIDPQHMAGLALKRELSRVSRLHLHLSLADGQVELGLLYDLPYAKTVSTKPLSADDWDVVVG
jgi:peroxin-1